VGNHGRLATVLDRGMRAIRPVLDEAPGGSRRVLQLAGLRQLDAFGTVD
jgi:hypothetical protein